MKKFVYILALLVSACNPVTKTHTNHVLQDEGKTSTVTDDILFSSISDDNDSIFSHDTATNFDDQHAFKENDFFVDDHRQLDSIDDNHSKNDDFENFADDMISDDMNDMIDMDDTNLEDNDFEQDSRFDDYDDTDDELSFSQDWDDFDDDIDVADDNQAWFDDPSVDDMAEDDSVVADDNVIQEDDTAIDDDISVDDQDSIIQPPNLNQLTLLSHIDPLRDQKAKYTGTGTYSDFCKNDTRLVLPIQQVPTQFAPSNFHSVKISHLAIVVDISDLSNPAIVSDIPSAIVPSVTGKDPGALDCAFKDNFMFLAGHHLYTPVYEITGNSLSLVNTYYYENHTLFIEKNKLYFASFDGSSLATIVDITNPYLSQPPITQFMLSANMIHDVTTVNDIAFYALWHGGFRIVNTSDKLLAPTVIGTITPSTGDAFHNAWPSKDQKYLFTSEERTDGGMAVYDISDMNNIKFVSRFNISGTMLHNVVIMDHLAFIAHYKQGLVIVDISDPTHPVKIKQYDTYNGFQHINGNIGPWIGAWGIIVEKESDFVYRIFVEDTDSGAFIFRYYQ